MIANEIPEPIVRDHVQRLRELMQAADFAAVLTFHRANMLAFTGTEHTSSDRLTCGVVTREGQVIVLCPAFERPTVAGAEAIATIHTWEETEDPYQRLAQALAEAGVQKGTLGVDGRTWLNVVEGLDRALTDVRIESGEHLLREVRVCKTPAEQDVLREAHRQGEQAFLVLRDELLRAGVTEIELQQQLGERFAPQGIVVAPLIQSGPRGAVPHNPTGDRELAAGDTVVVDSVIRYRGYHNDITRTFAVGQPSAKAKEAYRVVRNAQAAAIEAAKPGVPCAKLDEIARKVISDAGFGEYFVHRLGHGMGLEGHEPPYLAGSETAVLRPGVCVTVEPGIYVPDEFGIRIEDDVLITDEGCEVISGELPTDVSGEFGE